MKKILVIWFTSLFLFGCSTTINSEENKPVQLTRATITSIEDDSITFQVLDPFEEFEKTSKQKENDPVSLTYTIDENTLFLQNGNIIKISAISSGMDVIFSSNGNTLSVLEIVSNN